MLQKRVSDLLKNRELTVENANLKTQITTLQAEKEEQSNPAAKNESKVRLLAKDNRRLRQNVFKLQLMVIKKLVRNDSNDMSTQTPSRWSELNQAGNEAPSNAVTFGWRTSDAQI